MSIQPSAPGSAGSVQTLSQEHREPFQQLVHPDGRAFIGLSFFPGVEHTRLWELWGSSRAATPGLCIAPFSSEEEPGDCCYSW